MKGNTFKDYVENSSDHLKKPVADFRKVVSFVGFLERRQYLPAHYIHSQKGKLQSHDGQGLNPAASTCRGNKGRFVVKVGPPILG